MNITAILLAAGQSSRFGGDKLLYPLPNGELIAVASARKLKAVFEHCIAVVRETDKPLQQLLFQLDYHIVTQSNLHAGMGDNVALAVAACQHADAWVIALADMPWIQVETLQLIHTSLQNGASITAPSFNHQRGHPVGFNYYFRDSLLALHGDKGAKALLSKHNIQLLSVNDAGVLYDVDRKEDLSKYI